MHNKNMSDILGKGEDTHKFISAIFFADCKTHSNLRMAYFTLVHPLYLTLFSKYGTIGSRPNILVLQKLVFLKATSLWVTPFNWVNCFHFLMLMIKFFTRDGYLSWNHMDIYSLLNLISIFKWIKEVVWSEWYVLNISFQSHSLISSSSQTDCRNYTFKNCCAVTSIYEDACLTRLMFYLVPHSASHSC